jgi:hypothetical protein
MKNNKCPTVVLGNRDMEIGEIRRSKMVLGSKQDESPNSHAKIPLPLIDEFRNVFPLIVNCITEDFIFEGLKLTKNWVTELLQYNVPHGKLARYEGTYRKTVCS